MATRQEVYAAIDSERDYQDARWNPETTTSHGNHSFEEWIIYMEDYLAEAKHLLARGAQQDTEVAVAHIMRKVTAMGVACMEQRGAPPRVEVKPQGLREAPTANVISLAEARKAMTRPPGPPDPPIVSGPKIVA